MKIERFRQLEEEVLSARREGRQPDLPQEGIAFYDLYCAWYERGPFSEAEFSTAKELSEKLGFGSSIREHNVRCGMCDKCTSYESLMIVNPNTYGGSRVSKKASGPGMYRVVYTSILGTSGREKVVAATPQYMRKMLESTKFSEMDLRTSVSGISKIRRDLTKVASITLTVCENCFRGDDNAPKKNLWRDYGVGLEDIVSKVRAARKIK